SIQGQPLPDMTAYHAQQAAEKSFKAFLPWHAQRRSKTHSLVRLGKACVKIEPSLTSISRRVAPIGGFADATRYPGPSSEPSEQDARQALEVAQGLFDAIVALLPPETKP